MAATHELLLLIEFLLSLHHLLLEWTRCISRVVSKSSSLGHLSLVRSSKLINLREPLVVMHFTTELVSLLHIGVISLVKEDASVLSIHLLTWVTLHHLLLLLLHHLLLTELSLNLPCLIFG